MSLKDLKGLFEVAAQIKTIVDGEIEANKKLKTVVKTDLKAYRASIYQFDKITSDLDGLNNDLDDIIDHHSINFVIINNMQLCLDKHLQYLTEFIRWINQGTFKYAVSACCSKDQRSVVKTKKLKKYIVQLNDNLIIMRDLRDRIFGSALRIKHPVLRNAWLLLGENQLNDTSIKTNLIEDNLYQLLKVETKNKALNKIKWRPRVHKLLKVIDSSCLSAEDTRLSIMEMNSLDKEYMKYVNVKKLLKMIDESVEDDSSEENDSSEDSCKGVSLEMILPIIRGPYNFGLDVNFTSMGELVGSAVSDRLDNCNGYGSDFPFSRICEFILPDLDTSNDYDSSYLNLDIKACDQGWGGTGHVQVRYQINDGECLHGFNVNRDNNITGEYNISIPLDQTLHSSDKIILYLLCPTWGGWCANVSSVEGEICYE
jgi:hypothetical protein|tara:strand:- start:211 stop:1491 length:1281 start_codon:yes stop_codon:yes gene_type:complete